LHTCVDLGCSTEVVKCCNDDECPADSQVCEFYSCIPKGEMQFTLVWIGNGKSGKVLDTEVSISKWLNL
jgi:hypothetical protein